MKHGYSISDDSKTVMLWLDREGRRIVCEFDAEKEANPMTGAEAARILKHPRFGDARHIEALGVYEQIVRLKALRDECADEQGLEVLADVYQQRPIPGVEDLTAGQIEFEINFWEAVEERVL
jgi:hypothetical protein